MSATPSAQRAPPPSRGQQINRASDNQSISGISFEQALKSEQQSAPCLWNSDRLSESDVLGCADVRRSSQGGRHHAELQALGRAVEEGRRAAADRGLRDDGPSVQPYDLGQVIPARTHHDAVWHGGEWTPALLCELAEAAGSREGCDDVEGG
eukprot:6195725-Pleurochrysis_carterae.AAC.11